MKLHELHKRRLETTVSLVEVALDRMEKLLTEGGQNGIVRAVQNTLASEERSSLSEKIRGLRLALHVFAEQFCLQQHPVDIRRILNAEMSSAWVMLENCRPKRMKGQGVEFEPQTRMALEESVEQLINQVNSLQTMLR